VVVFQHRNLLLPKNEALHPQGLFHLKELKKYMIVCNNENRLKAVAAVTHFLPPHISHCIIIRIMIHRSRYRDSTTHTLLGDNVGK